MKRIGFIGAGNMGGALARAVARAEGEIYVCDVCEEKARALAAEVGGRTASDREIAAECDFIFLAVKPNTVAAVLSPLAEDIARGGAVLVSMAAGVAIENIEKLVGTGVPVLRIMPNTPAAVGRGMILWTRNCAVSEEAVSDFLLMMRGAGTLDELDERLIDAGSALSGCGPAFVYMFIEALADGGVMSGLPRDKAMLYAAETLIGAAEVVKQTGRHPGALKDAVCSPGGSTIEGVKALEDGKMRGTVSGAVVAAYEKTLKLGK